MNPQEDNNRNFEMPSNLVPLKRVARNPEKGQNILKEGEKGPELPENEPILRKTVYLYELSAFKDWWETVERQLMNVKRQFNFLLPPFRWSEIDWHLELFLKFDTRGFELQESMLIQHNLELNQLICTVRDWTGTEMHQIVFQSVPPAFSLYFVYLSLDAALDG